MTLPFDLGVLRVAAPAWLIPLVVVPLLLFVGRSRLAATFRALAATAVLLVLAGVYVEEPRPAGGTCVVAAIDVSASVQRAGIEAAHDFLARLLPRLGVDDVVGTLAFAAVPRLIARPSASPPLESLLPREPGVDTGDTNLGATLAAAASLCPAGKEAALVLVTDGNETVGSLAAEVAVTEPVMPIYLVVPPAAALPPAAIRRVIAPAFTPERTVLPLEVVLESRADRPVSGILRLTANGEELALESVEVPPGLSRTALAHRWDGAGQFRIEAELLLPAGTPAPPGPASTALTVTQALRVLVVSEHEAPVVAAALGRRGTEVRVAAPTAAEGPLAGPLDGYHLVVLDDVGRARLTTDALERLARYVGSGGALVATGGAHLFGDPGFVGTALERILPVALQSQAPEPREREPIALYLLIDRSNSMGYATSPTTEYGEKMEYAKRAALAVLEQLAPSDLAGAIAFDAQPYELGPLRPVAQGREALMARIAQLRYGGGTDFKEALDIALESLLQLDRRVRHIILLTDGDTNRRAPDHDALIAALARAGITVTAIRIGSDTVNLELLERIARETGGEFHHVEDVQSLPQLMIHDAQQLIDTAANRRESRVYVGDAGPILAGIDEDELPPVTGWAITRPKPGAELRLYVESGERQDPVLATWQYRLGRVAVVPVDFQAGGARWPVWRGFTQLWSQLALWAAPHALPGEWQLDARPERDGAVVTLRAVSDGGEPFRLRLPGQGEVGLHGTGRRRFSAFVPGLHAGVHAGVLVSGTAPTLREHPVELMVAAAAASGRESRVREPDLRQLAAVAARTGGTLAPEPAAVLAARGGTARRTRPLETWLIPLALLLVLADVATRRRAGSTPHSA